MSSLKRKLEIFWKFFQDLIGESDYERYLEHYLSEHPGKQPLTKQEFYMQETERKWNNIRKCC